MKYQAVIQQILDSIFAVTSDTEWRLSVERYGPAVKQDRDLSRELMELVAVWRNAGHLYEASLVEGWMNEVFDPLGFKLKRLLTRARTEAEILEILEANREAARPELVESALEEAYDLLDGQSPYPPEQAMALAHHILSVNIILSRFLENPGLEAACLKLRSHVFASNANYTQAIEDLFQAEALFREAGNQIEAGRCLGIAGRLRRQEGRPQEGLDHLLKSAAILEELDDIQHLGITYQEIALTYNDLGEEERTWDSFERALNYRLESGQWAQAAMLLPGLASHYYVLEQPDRSFPFFQKLVELYTAPPDEAALPPLEPDTIILLTDTVFRMAVRKYESTRLDQSFRPASSTVREPMGEDPAGLDSFPAWLDLAMRANRLADIPSARAYLALTEANQRFREDDLEGCLEKVLPAIDYFRKGEHREPLATLHAYNLAVESARQLGRAQQAMVWGEEALELARQLDDPLHPANWLSSLGLCAYDTGMLDQALAYLQEGLELAEQSEAEERFLATGAMQGLVGKILLDLGDAKAAARATLAAYEAAQRLGYLPGEGSELQNLAQLLVRIEQRPQPGVLEEVIPTILKDLSFSALPVLDTEMTPEKRLRGLVVLLFERSANLLRQAGDELRLANALHGLALQLPDEDERVFPILEEALKVRRKLGDRLGEAFTLGSLGAWYANHGQNEQARRAYLACLEIAWGAGFFNPAYKAAKDLGRLYEADGDLDSAQKYYREAIEWIESTREKTPFLDQYRSGFTEDKQDPYHRLHRLALAGKDPGEAYAIVQRAKSRALLEITATWPATPARQAEGRFAELLAAEAELLELRRRAINAATQSGPGPRQNTASAGPSPFETTQKLKAIYREMEAYDPEFVALRQGLPVTLPRMRAWLQAQGRPVLLVEYFFDGRELAGYCLRQDWDEARTWNLPLSNEQLWSAYQDFQREVVRYKSRGSMRWTRLAQTLVDPLEAFLEPGDLVYFIPHRLLHAMPLHALPFQGAPLIAQFPVAYAPAAGLLPLCQLPGKGTERLESCAAFGVVFQEEARLVARLFGAEPVLGERLSEQEIAGHIQGRDICHFSCHGYFNRLDPLSSGLVLEAGPAAPDSLLTARQIMGMQFKNELVCLSACQTGVHRISEADELLGLVRAFLYAGASSILVSLWEVDAALTQDLMLSFYDQLLKTYRESGKIDKAGALQCAQTEIMQREGERNAYAWAPFVLVGDWR